MDIYIRFKRNPTIHSHRLDGIVAFNESLLKDVFFLTSWGGNIFKKILSRVGRIVPYTIAPSNWKEQREEKSARVQILEREAQVLQKRLEFASRNNGAVKEHEKWLTRIFRLLEAGKEAQAEAEIDAYLDRYRVGPDREEDTGNLEDTGLLVYEQVNKKGKSIFQSVPSPDVVAKRAWHFKRLPERRLAKLEDWVCCPYGPRRHVAGRYLVEEDIQGPDLFALISYLNDRIAEGRAEAHWLKLVLIADVTRHIAFMHEIGDFLPPELAEPSTCVNEGHWLALWGEWTPKQKEKLIRMGERLDEITHVQLRDAGLWNYKMNYMGFLEKLKAYEPFNQLQESYTWGAITERELTDIILETIAGGLERFIHKGFRQFELALIENVYPYDFSTFGRKTFPWDDVIHVLESPIANLSEEETRRMKAEFLRHVPVEPDTRQPAAWYFQDFDLQSFYRHIGFIKHYQCGNIPHYNDSHAQFHWQHAYAAIQRVYGEAKPRKLPHLRSPAKQILDIVEAVSI
ncbi:hypothetical protein HYS48_03830 [Candidatus Woesearchaeota archaeon]|nr:hypothetical protein [Candidatus Woesearchaeota archaeon]